MADPHRVGSMIVSGGRGGQVTIPHTLMINEVDGNSIGYVAYIDRTTKDHTESYRFARAMASSSDLFGLLYRLVQSIDSGDLSLTHDTVNQSRQYLSQVQDCFDLDRIHPESKLAYPYVRKPDTVETK